MNIIHLNYCSVSSCLSNQGTCSVATYRYNPACRSQLDSGSSSYHGSYNGNLKINKFCLTQTFSGFLGAHVRARAYSERGSLSDYARKDAELHCLSALNCTWQNTVEDDLDWVLGEGYVDPTKLALITGSQSLPGSFGMFRQLL